MKQHACCAATLTVVIMMLLEQGLAFCPQQQQQQQQRSVSLQLLPGQGSQLVAAYNAAMSHQDDDDDNEDDDGSIGQYHSHKTAMASSPHDHGIVVEQTIEPASSSSHWRALAASKSFVARAFHMPSSAIKKHPHPTLEGLKETPSSSSSSAVFPYNFIPHHQEQHEDVVLYPIVGFRFVPDSKNGGKSVALPTTFHAACRLPMNRNEDVYGWFSPGCKLDLYSEDVCHEPEGEHL
mmetsp:Transcript_16392/g.29398  ORF Transcript_16392/g.29398 Transcript_16392/m.29398 type:complete len:236 (-) Transcript_16392:347-1054(-)